MLKDLCMEYELFKKNNLEFKEFPNEGFVYVVVYFEIFILKSFQSFLNTITSFQEVIK